MKSNEVSVREANEKVEELNQRITELKLENDTQADLLDHQQTLINNQTNDFSKVRSEQESNVSHINEQNQQIEQLKAFNEAQQDEIAELKEKVELIEQLKASNEAQQEEIAELKEKIKNQMTHQATEIEKQH